MPLQILFEDQVLSCPNSLETTVNSVKAGSELVGLVSQFIWSQPGFTDDRQHMIDMVKSIGIVKSKNDEDFIVNTYLDDGLPGYSEIDVCGICASGKLHSASAVRSETSDIMGRSALRGAEQDCCGFGAA